jgi:hypothetical protein
VGYVPTGLDEVAVALHAGAPLTAAAVSPLTKPTSVAVSVGFDWPYVLALSSAVTVSEALVTLKGRPADVPP